MIGGIAAIAHGVPRNTFDLDILIDATAENARRLLDALLDIGLGTAGLTTPDELLKKEITTARGADGVGAVVTLVHRGGVEASSSAARSRCTNTGSW